MTGLASMFGGSLLIRIQGRACERFLNLCGGRNVLLWNVKYRDNAMEAWILRRDFFRLRPIVRKTKVKVAVLRKSGLPFLLPKLRRRFVFVTGALMALSFWILSSFFLWEIQINGNVAVTKDQFEAFLREQNVRLGEPFGKIDLTNLEKEIRRTFPQIIWTSVKQDGTELIIDVKENDLERDEQEERSEQEPSEEAGEGWSLVSECDGIVRSMITRKGVPKVKIGDEVKKGQVLVEGRVPVMGEDGMPKGYLMVRADADVMIEREEHWEDAVERNVLENVYTGRERKEFYVALGKHVLRIKLGNAFYRETAVGREYSPKIFESLEIPVRFGQLVRSEYLPTLGKRSDSDMEALCNEKISQFLASLEEKGVQIIEKDVKIGDEGNFMQLKGNFVVQELACTYERLE